MISMFWRTTADSAHRPNLVFLDVWLKGSRLDGLQLLDSLKQEHPVRRGAAPISQKALAISREVTPLLQMRQGTDYTFV